MDLSPPELRSLGSLLLTWVAPVAGALSVVCSLLRWRRLTLAFGVVALLGILSGVAALMNIFCLAGYTAYDGSCAEE